MSDALKIYGVGRTINDNVYVIPRFPLFGSPKDTQSFIDCLDNPIGKISVEMQIIVPAQDDEDDAN
tara:strand:+ start:565 stop:762 length:198 start_codon:yes stop_codon:yes gene_type:complete